MIKHGAIFLIMMVIGCSNNSSIDEEKIGNDQEKKLRSSERIIDMKDNVYFSLNRRQQYEYLVSKMAQDKIYEYEPNKQLIDNLFIGKLWVTPKGYDEYCNDHTLKMVNIKKIENNIPQYEIVKIGCWNRNQAGEYVMEFPNERYSFRITGIEIQKNISVYRIIFTLNINQCYAICLNKNYDEMPLYMFNYPE